MNAYSYICLLYGWNIEPDKLSVIFPELFIMCMIVNIVFKHWLFQFGSLELENETKHYVVWSYYTLQRLNFVFYSLHCSFFLVLVNFC